MLGPFGRYLNSDICWRGEGFGDVQLPRAKIVICVLEHDLELVFSIIRPEP